jgi:hypothetical protein
VPYCVAKARRRRPRDAASRAPSRRPSA